MNEYDDHTYGSNDGWRNAGTPEWNSSSGSGSSGGSGRGKKSGGLGKRILVTLLCAVIFGAAAGGVFLGVSRAGMALMQNGSGASAGSVSEASDDENEAALPDTSGGTSSDTSGSSSSNASSASSAAVRTGSNSTGGTATVTTMPVTGGSYSSLEELVSAVMPSVVAVTSTTEYQYYYSGMFGQRGSSDTYTAVGAGSGVIYGETDDEILIITNYHVIASADSLMVTFLDDVDNEDANVTAYLKGMDQSLDLAIIAVEKSDIADYILDQLVVATIGDSSAVSVGESVIAIGNALAYGQSVTAGIISATDRDLATEITEMEGLIQTDAAINNGNSGGGLFNMNGELIGINVAKTSGSGYTTAIVENMGYAIPVSEELKAIEDMAGQETRITVSEEESCFLGIQNYQTVTEDISSSYGMPVGVYVSRVVEGSPAEEAGMRDGDIITEFDGHTVTSSQDLLSLLRYYSGGTEVQVTVQRSSANQYHEVILNVTLGYASDFAQ